jgi:hypothetical protein
LWYSMMGVDTIAVVVVLHRGLQLQDLAVCVHVIIEH